MLIYYDTTRKIDITNGQNQSVMIKIHR